MTTIVPFLKNAKASKTRAAILLSGSGSNAEKILERWQSTGQNKPFDITAIFTDAPERSRARELADIFNIKLLTNDIRQFYRDRGQSRISIATPEGQRIREEWTESVKAQLRERNVDFCIMAGFMPLTNLTTEFLSLNVHPGDLTYLQEDKRHLAGLHTVPIERAILAGLDYLRSSVIIAQPYTGKGDEMDSGPILGISEKVDIDLAGKSLAELQACAAARPGQRPPGGYKDELESIAARNQENLKRRGDWVVFPQVVFDFARNRFGQSPDGQLYFNTGRVWAAIETVVYGRHQRELILQKPEA